MIIEILKSTASCVRSLFLSDRAVRYSLLSRVFSLAIGPIMLFSIGTFLHPEEQGIYYVFGSLMQLAVLIDLGFSKSSQQILAHDFGPLTYHPKCGVAGNSPQLDQFFLAAKSIFKIYAILAIVALFVLGTIGHVYLNHNLHPSKVNVIYPWWAMIASLSIGMGLQGVTALADAMNLLPLTNKWRFISEVVGLTTFVGTLVLGGGIWAVVLLCWLRHLLTIIPISFSLGSRIWQQIHQSSRGDFSYHAEILPLQLRNMISYGMGFLIFFCYTPLTLSYSGAVAAGVVGMSLQIANIAQTTSTVWFNTKIPLMGNLAGRRARNDLLMIHLSGVKITTYCWIIVAAFILFGAFLGKMFLPNLSTRYGSMLEISLFIAGSGGFTWAHVRAAFLRAYRIEPFVILSVAQAISTIALLFVMIPMLGTLGAALSYAVTMMLGACWTEIAYRSFKNGSHKLSYHQHI